MLTKPGTVFLGALGLTVVWALSFSTANATEKQGASDIQVWTREAETIERPYDPVKAKRLQDLAYKVFDPPFAIRCGNFDIKQISARFGGIENRLRLRRRHRGAEDTEFARLVGIWDYPGLSIEVWAEFVLTDVVTWLRTITIASPDYPLQHGLSIGAPFSEIVELFGEPTPPQRKTEKGREIFYCSRGIHVTFLLDEQDRLAEITLRCGELCP